MGEACPQPLTLPLSELYRLEDTFEFILGNKYLKHRVQREELGSFRGLSLQSCPLWFLRSTRPMNFSSTTQHQELLCWLYHGTKIYSRGSQE